MAGGGDPGGDPADSEPHSIRTAARSGLKRELAFALRSQADLPADLGRTRTRSLKPAHLDAAVDDESEAKRIKKSAAGSAESPLVIDDDRRPVSPVPARGPSRSTRLQTAGSAATPIALDDDDDRRPANAVGPSTPAPPIAPYEAAEWPTRRVTRSMVKDPTENPSGEAAAAADDERAADGTSDGAQKADLNGKMELKMSKKISAATKIPRNVKDLLATGLLEGSPVKYITCLKTQVGLQGIIKGSAILCHCASCGGSKAVSAKDFERHAGSAKKYPASSIYFENGNSVRDVLEACNAAPLDMLEASIKSAICPMPKSSSCLKCNGKFAPLCNSCLERKQSQMAPSPLGLNDNCASISKASSTNKKSAFGKLTRKDWGLHKLVFVGDTLPEGTEVAYYVRGKRELEGYIKDSGIFCRCCSKVVTPSVFEAHAGHSQRRKPYNNIYTSNGVSLHELSVSLSKNRKLSDSENDDLCSICLDGGDLLLCDLCPRSFHIDCVGLSTIPTGDWHCRYCKNMHQRDKCVEHNDNAVAAGRVAGVDPIEQIFKRCIRIVQTTERNLGGCVFCRGHDFTKEFSPRTVIFCDQCEREYHVGCLKDNKMGNLKAVPIGEWFCCSDCKGINLALLEFVKHGEMQIQDLDSGIIKKRHKGKVSNKGDHVNIRWRLLRGKPAPSNTDDHVNIHRKKWLSAAINILHDSFDPISDGATSQDLIPAMVYGRETRDQDFGGMYCVVLTVNSSVVSTGLLRVLGRGVAELPLVATSRENQGKGYFKLLFSCIEGLLGTLNVEHFLLPAAEEAESIWTNKFGFNRITSDQLIEYTKGARPMVFQGTSMLHKAVPKPQILAQGRQ